MAVAAIAILTALAYPAYRAYLQRGWLNEGTSALRTYAQRMERAYDSNGNYGATACAVAVPAASVRWTITCGLQSAGQGFIATATGRESATGFAFTLDQSGAQRTTSFSGAATTRACWLVRGDEC